MHCWNCYLHWEYHKKEFIKFFYQTLTRVSISRNSRREMIQIFLSRSREANFHVSFSSRFSRIGGKVSLSPLDFQDLKIISLSFLDPFLFLLSTFKILEKISLSPLDFQDFENWSLHYWLRPIERGKLVLWNFTSHFIRVQIFQIDFALILSASKYFR